MLKEPKFGKKTRSNAVKRQNDRLQPIAHCCTETKVQWFSKHSSFPFKNVYATHKE